MENHVSKKWDLTTQTPHGGQEWREIENFLDDFSVTTNPFGPPINATTKCVVSPTSLVSHYPSSDYEPSKTHLSRFLIKSINSNFTDTETQINRNNDFSSCSQTNNYISITETNNSQDKSSHNKSDQNPHTNNSLVNSIQYEQLITNTTHKLILGNGASELIDLLVRLTPGKTWRQGPFDIQYKEYERSAHNNGFIEVDSEDKTSDLLCLVNPSNPTGQFMKIEDLKVYITETCKQGSRVIIDESMIVFYGAKWASQSLISEQEWISYMANEKSIYIFVIHSWTKIWSCPGLRIGSLLAPTVQHAQSIKKRQVPWSVNSIALAFLNEVTYDDVYLRQTWSSIKVWRDQMCTKIKQLKPNWTLSGETFLPFIWIQTNDAHEALFYYNSCKSKGVPIRWGGHGYGQDTHIRIGVKDLSKCTTLFTALNTPFLKT